MSDITCICGKVFQHTQNGRGRPPVKCPDCRLKPIEEKKDKVNITCSICSTVFDHIVKRGRLPSKCPSCKVKVSTIDDGKENRQESKIEGNSPIPTAIPTVNPVPAAPISSDGSYVTFETDGNEPVRIDGDWISKLPKDFSTVKVRIF